MNRISLGKLGEKLASEYLSSQKFNIVDRNYRERTFELDIVALDGDCLVVVEVKTRFVEDTITPEESITPRKIAKLKQGAYYYRMTHPQLPELLRLDFVGLRLNRDGSINSLNHVRSLTS